MKNKKEGKGFRKGYLQAIKDIELWLKQAKYIDMTDIEDRLKSLKKRRVNDCER